MEKSHIIELIKVIVLISVFYVLAIRYENIIKEFKQYGLPDWLRDLVGITKLVSVYLINFSSPTLSKAGSLTIAALMLAAMATHLRIKNPIIKILPSTTLFIICITLFLNS